MAKKSPEEFMVALLRHLDSENLGSIGFD